MANYRKAPKLYHEGSKPKGNFYQLPHSLMNKVFQKFDGKSGNAIKLLIVMIGSAGDGSFALSEKMIENRTGMSKQSYHRTMDSLEASGYVIRENGKVILNLPLLMKDEHDDDQESHRQTKKSTHDDEIRKHDDDYNKKRIKNNNKKSIEKNLAVDENEKRIENTLKRIGIDYAANTKRSITTLIGEEPQASVLDELVRKNFSAWENAKSESQSYRYGILKKLLQTEYHGLKLKLEAEREAEERTREEKRMYPPSLLEDCFRRAAANKPQEGLDDISELLDDWGEEDDDRQASQTPYDPLTLQRMITEMKRQRKADALEWDDDEEDNEL